MYLFKYIFHRELRIISLDQIRLWTQQQMITDISRELVLLEQVQRLNYNSTFIIGTSDRVQECTAIMKGYQALWKSILEVQSGVKYNRFPLLI